MYSYQQVFDDLTVIANHAESDLYNNPDIFKALKEYSNFYFIQLFSDWIKKKAELEVGEQFLKDTGALVTVNFYDYFGECAAVSNPDVLPKETTLYFVYRVDREPNQSPNDYRSSLIWESPSPSELKNFLGTIDQTNPEATCIVLVSVPDARLDLLKRKIH